MKHVVFKQPIGATIVFPARGNCAAEQALLVGKFANGRPLLVRDWGNEDDVNTRLGGDEAFFAPFVRKIRLKNYRLHKAAAKNPISDVYRDGSEYFGKTWVLVGSGPSIESQVDEIRAIRDAYPDAVVVAINDAMRVIGPSSVHGFIALCWLSNPKWWKFGYLELLGTDLFTSFYTPIEILKAFAPENTYHFSMPLKDRMTPYVAEDLAIFGGLDAGLTVSYSALHLAFRCRAKKIILLGQDLAYTNGRDHAFEPLPWNPAQKQNYVVVSDINGNTTFTDKRLICHRALIAGGVFWCERAGIPVYNASGQGILKLGPGRNLTLAAALAAGTSCRNGTLGEADRIALAEERVGLELSRKGG